MIKKFSITFLLLVGCAVGLIAQNAASPYSIYGIGKLSGYGLAYHNNMGGLGISVGREWILNNVNPALLPMNNFTTFDAGLYVENRSLITTDLTESSVNGGLNYLAFGFPIKDNKWTMSFGLMPYSNVSYNMGTASKVVNRDETDAVYQYKGSGGINQVFMSNGWNIIQNFLSVGARIGYAFGYVKDETFVDLNETVYTIVEDDTLKNSKDFLTSNYYRSSSYSDFLFEGGIHVVRKIGKLDVNLGFVYELEANMNTTRDERVEIIDTDNLLSPVNNVEQETKGNTYLPPKFGYGLSIGKRFKWSIGADFYTRDWSKYNSDFGDNQELSNSYSIILGAEFTPDFFAVTNILLNRSTYQFGLNYEQTPLMINNTNIDDFGINFGVSLPVGQASILNIGFKYGQLGTTTNGLIREDYIKFNLGMTFNDRSFAFYRNRNKYN